MQVQLATQIAAVTVYPDRARVTRRATAALEPGPHTLVVPELPLKLNPESVRATAQGSARARLLGVQVQRTFYSETPVEPIRRLEEQIEALEDELKALDAQAELIETDRTALAALAGHTEIYATALAAGEQSVAAQLVLFDGLRARSAALYQEYQQTAAAHRACERQLAKLKNELDQQRSARPRERYVALVEMEVLEAGELSLDLSYLVPGAGWQPLYDLRFSETEAPLLELGYLAQVTQQTGEAWEAVALTLSTARPALAGRLPELDPWYIQPRQLLAPVAAAPAPQAFMALAEPPRSKRAEVVAAEEVTASVDSSGAAVTYRLPAHVSVPADGAPHKVVVARYRLEPQLDYVCAPKLVAAAYRRATVANDSPYTLLPGPANLFAGEEFIGVTRLELTAPQGEIELYLGVDDRVKVERELKRREVDKRLISGKRRIRYGYEIELENLRSVPVKITLHDQMPLARHEEIKVRLEAAEPRPTEQSELHLLDWELNLAANEKRSLRFDFSVEYPQEMDIVGLP